MSYVMSRNMMNHEFRSNSSLDTQNNSPHNRLIKGYLKTACNKFFIARKLPAKNYFSTEITVVKYLCQIHVQNVFLARHGVEKTPILFFTSMKAQIS